MALTSDPPKHEPAQMFAFENASWELYELLLRDLERQNVRITYDTGRMLLSRPLIPRTSMMLDRLVALAALERDIPISSFGSTTWRRRDLAKGIEADKSYYFRNQPVVRGRTDIDLKKDPPPDLAIEIEITHNPLDRESIYAALGVHEIWKYDGEHFHFVRKTATGGYEPIAASEALPFITPEILEHFIGLMLENENPGLRAFRDWLRSNASN